MAIEKDTTYNGWKNYETWNVILWLDNDEGFYSLVQEFGNRTYEDFVYDFLLEHTTETPDGVKWLDRKLDWEALDKYMEKNCDANNEE
jgi:hypothetical protein